MKNDSSTPRHHTSAAPVTCLLKQVCLQQVAHKIGWRGAQLQEHAAVWQRQLWQGHRRARQHGHLAGKSVPACLHTRPPACLPARPAACLCRHPARLAARHLRACLLACWLPAHPPACLRACLAPARRLSCAGTLLGSQRTTCLPGCHACLAVMPACLSA